MKADTSVLESTSKLIEILRDIQSGEPQTLTDWPEITGMLCISPTQKSILSIEHTNDGENPVWEHLVTIISRKLLGVETGDMSLFQCDNALNKEEFAFLKKSWDDMAAVPGMAVVLRAALLFEDVSKGMGTRKTWEKLPKIDFNIHNEASALILTKTGILNRFETLTDIQKNLIIALIHSHGLMGQLIRGEITEHIFLDWIDFIQEHAAAFAEQLTAGNREDAVRTMRNAYFLLNVIDTAGVREGLMTGALLKQFIDVDCMLKTYCESDNHRALLENSAFQASDELSRDKCIAYLSNRLKKFRTQRQQNGESENAVSEVLYSLKDSELQWLVQKLSVCQFWYCEAASGGLSVASQLKLIALGAHEWMNLVDYDSHQLFHLDLGQVAALLSPHSCATAPELAISRANYRRRLLDAILSEQTLEDIINGKAQIYKSDDMFAVCGMRGCLHSVSLCLQESEEAEALITLLSIYERKSSVAFHSALKLLCDLYHLRKDEFDRLANEEKYLLTMNAARSDKERMLRWLHSGKIVEIGPGGGVVLELLEQKFPDAEIIGLDLSHQVILALEQRKKQNNARWQVIEGNAFELPSLFEKDSLDGVIFCSILHEIYSYVEAEDGSKFHLESVRNMLQAAFRTLKPGGRILIRDGIMPPHAMRKLKFLCDDAKVFFEAFCKEFKGRTVIPNFVEPDTVLLDSADAMEFMYTYTWGPDSFPYEVREQYGIMRYSEYCRNILEWLGKKARIVPVSPEEACYLQEGYVTALKDRLLLMDVDGNEVRFPASNAIIVIEKCGG